MISRVVINDNEYMFSPCTGDEAFLTSLPTLPSRVALRSSHARLDSLEIKRYTAGMRNVFKTLGSFKVSTRTILEMGVCLALLIGSAQVAYGLPGAGGVPFTLQTFAVALAGFVLGARRGAACVAAYLLLGVAGLPVFAWGFAGIARFAGPTGGFLVGFIPMAALCGQRRAYPAAAGLMICHLIGLLWFAGMSGVSVWSAFMTVSLPFWLKDAASMVFAHLTWRIWGKGFRILGFPRA